MKSLRHIGRATLAAVLLSAALGCSSSDNGPMPFAGDGSVPNASPLDASSSDSADSSTPTDAGAPDSNDGHASGDAEAGSDAQLNPQDGSDATSDANTDASFDAGSDAGPDADARVLNGNVTCTWTEENLSPDFFLCDDKVARPTLVEEHVEIRYVLFASSNVALHFDSEGMTRIFASSSDDYPEFMPDSTYTQWSTSGFTGSITRTGNTLSVSLVRGQRSSLSSCGIQRVSCDGSIHVPWPPPNFTP